MTWEQADGNDAWGMQWGKGVCTISILSESVTFPHIPCSPTWKLSKYFIFLFFLFFFSFLFISFLFFFFFFFFLQRRVVVCLLGFFEASLYEHEWLNHWPLVTKLIPSPSPLPRGPCFLYLLSFFPHYCTYSWKQRDHWANTKEKQREQHLGTPETAESLVCWTIDSSMVLWFIWNHRCL